MLVIVSGSVRVYGTKQNLSFTTDSGQKMLFWWSFTSRASHCSHSWIIEAAAGGGGSARRRQVDRCAGGGGGGAEQQLALSGGPGKKQAGTYPLHCSHSVHLTPAQSARKRRECWRSTEQKAHRRRTGPNADLCFCWCQRIQRAGVWSGDITVEAVWGKWKFRTTRQPCGDRPSQATEGSVLDPDRSNANGQNQDERQPGPGPLSSGDEPRPTWVRDFRGALIFDLLQNKSMFTRCCEEHQGHVGVQAVTPPPPPPPPPHHSHTTYSSLLWEPAACDCGRGRGAAISLSKVTPPKLASHLWAVRTAIRQLPGGGEGAPFTYCISDGPDALQNRTSALVLLVLLILGPLTPAAVPQRSCPPPVEGVRGRLTGQM